MAVLININLGMLEIEEIMRGNKILSGIMPAKFKIPQAGNDDNWYAFRYLRKKTNVEAIFSFSFDIYCVGRTYFDMTPANAKNVYIEDTSRPFLDPNSEGFKEWMKKYAREYGYF